MSRALVHILQLIWQRGNFLFVVYILPKWLCGDRWPHQRRTVLERSLLPSGVLQKISLGTAKAGSFAKQLNQHTEYLIRLGSVSNSYHLINRMLGKEEQKTFQGLIRVSNVNDWMLRLIPRLFFLLLFQERKSFLTAFTASLEVCPRLLIIWDPIMKFSKKILVSFRLQWLNQIKFLKHRSCKTDVSQGLYSPS